jgi:glycerol-3-phosphate dehydrogenase (NAD(P)+)
MLWARNPDIAAELNSDHQHYLGTHPVARELRATASMAEAVSGADVVVMGVPSHGFAPCSSWCASTSGPGCR